MNILRIDSEVYSGEVKNLFLTALDGALQVLPNHAPYVNKIVSGKITFIDKDDKSNELFTSEGFIKIDNNTATLFV